MSEEVEFFLGGAEKSLAQKVESNSAEEAACYAAALTGVAVLRTSVPVSIIKTASGYEAVAGQVEGSVSYAESLVSYFGTGVEDATDEEIARVWARDFRPRLELTAAEWNVGIEKWGKKVED